MNIQKRIMEIEGANTDPSKLPGALTLEQQFHLQQLRTQVASLSLEDAQNYVIEIARQMMVKENLIKHLIKTNG